jgi:hypothetical protein
MLIGDDGGGRCFRGARATVRVLSCTKSRIQQWYCVVVGAKEKPRVCAGVWQSRSDMCSGGVPFNAAIHTNHTYVRCCAQECVIELDWGDSDNILLSASENFTLAYVHVVTAETYPRLWPLAFPRV